MEKLRLSVAVSALVLGFASVTACGGSDEDSGSSNSATGGTASGTGGAASGTGGTASGTGGAASGTGGAAALDCTTLDLANLGTPVTEEQQSGIPYPTMTGGTLADGVYVLTGRKIWGDSCGCTAAVTLEISGSGTVIKVVSQNDGDPEKQMGGTLAFPDENSLVLDLPCPGGILALDYTVTATGFEHWDSQKERLEIFTKQ